jgi:hypothetical protein
MSQGLLAAMGAAVRAKLRGAQAAQPRLQSRGRRERAQAALLDAAAAIQAAQELTQGGRSATQRTLACACHCRDTLHAKAALSESVLNVLACACMPALG